MAAHLSRRAASTSRRLSQALSRAMEPPDDFLCPMSHAIMDDPVVAADGHTYEKAAMERVLQAHRDSGAQGNPRSPMTNAPLAHTTLTTAWSVKSQCDRWREENTGRKGA